MRLLLSTTLLFCMLNQYSFSNSLSDQINRTVHQDLPHATVAILIKDAKSGQIIYKKNADKLMAPASNIKLFTAAAALYQWSPEQRFNTQLFKDQNDYYISFGGSPSLNKQDLKQMIVYLKQHHGSTIKGNIFIDDSYFQAPYYSAGVSYDDLGYYYAAPNTAIVLNENAERYLLFRENNAAHTTQIKPQGKEPQLTIINQVVTVDKEVAQKHCALNLEIEQNNKLRLYGCTTHSKTPLKLDLAIPNPELLAQQTIQQALNENNMQLLGSITKKHAPKHASLVLFLQSKPLNQLIDHMLKESDNLYADNLTRHMAVALTHEGTPKQAVFALNDILAHHTHLDMSQIELADGIGTRYNLATAEQIVILLTDIYNNKKIFPTLFKSLPQSGVSGSLKTRMKKTILDKKVYAKTGTMHDISSLSGYLITPNNDPIIFSIMINGINKPIHQAKELEEKILLLIEENINEITANQSAYA